jgi:hypothetical protein
MTQTLLFREKAMVLTLLVLQGCDWSDAPVGSDDAAHSDDSVGQPSMPRSYNSEAVLTVAGVEVARGGVDAFLSAVSPAAGATCAPSWRLYFYMGETEISFGDFFARRPDPEGATTIGSFNLDDRAFVLFALHGDEGYARVGADRFTVQSWTGSTISLLLDGAAVCFAPSLHEAQSMDWVLNPGLCAVEGEVVLHVTPEVPFDEAPQLCVEGRPGPWHQDGLGALCVAYELLLCETGESIFAPPAEDTEPEVGQHDTD